ncbi:MAG TPA: acyltransferase domain-containing protein, partial [Vampirovibrionales bacterium]
VDLHSHSIVASEKLGNVRVGAVFPGQGAQKLNMGYKLKERHDWAKDLINEAEGVFKQNNAQDILGTVFKPLDRLESKEQEKEWKNSLKQTDVAQPAIVLNSLLWQEYLKKVGVQLTAVTGHSLGELSAFYASGFYTKETLLAFANFRGQSMAKCGSGSMASIFCNQEQVETLMKEAPGYVTIANINTLKQIVISGEKESIDFVLQQARLQGIQAVELPVSAAFHSALIADTAVEIKKSSILSNKEKPNTAIKLISSVNGSILGEDTDLHSYFATQAMNQVNFVTALEELQKHCDILLEVGPGRIFSGLVSNITDDICCFSLEAEAEDDVSLNTALLNLYVKGVDIQLEEIYKGRLIRKFEAVADKKFIVNPLERPFPEDIQEKIKNIDLESFEEDKFYTDSVNQPQSTNNANLLGMIDLPFVDMESYLQHRGEFIKDVILSDLRHTKAQSPKVLSTHKTEEVITKHSSNTAEETNLLIKEKQISTTNPKKTVHNLFVKESASSSQIKEEVPAETHKDIQSIVFRNIAEETGFPENQLQNSFRLLDDLNLDSIKAGTVLSKILKEFNLLGKIVTENHSNSTIEEIIEIIKKEYTLNLSQTTNPEQLQKITFKEESVASKSSVNVNKEVLLITSELTGFPENSIQTSFRLLDDLNLDSIKAGTLITEIAKKFNLLGKLEPSNFSNSTLEEIISEVENKLAVGNNESIKEQSQVLKNVNSESLEQKPLESNSQPRTQSYIATCKYSPLQQINNLDFISQKEVALFYEDSQEELVERLEKELVSFGATVSLYKLSEEKELQEETEYVLTILPHTSGALNVVKESAELLSKLARVTASKDLHI